MKRVLAVLGAALMVAAAVLVRDRLDDDGGGGGGGSGDRAADGDGIDLVCAVELEQVCDVLSDEGGVSVTVEEAHATVDRLAADRAAAAGVDGWVTFAPWPEMANIVAGSPIFVEGVEALASSGVLVHVPEGPASCLGPDIWRCLGQFPLAVGMRPPDGGLGAVLYGAAAAGYFGRPDFSTNDIELDDGFAAWSRQLLADPDDDPLGELLRVYPPTERYHAVAGLQADVPSRIAGSRAALHLVPVEPAPPVRVAVVIAPVAASPDREHLDDLDGVRSAVSRLTDAGWEPGSAATGLPAPGVLVSLAGLS